MSDRVRKLTLAGMFCAIAYVLMLVVRVPVGDFLTYDPKDVVVALGGFIVGPLCSLAISFTVALIEMFTVSSTRWIGMVMNALASCTFAFTASAIYSRRRTLRGAVAGLCVAILTTTAIMIMWNYIITPLYVGSMTREAIVPMLWSLILPFNLFKSGLNAALTMLLYRPVTRALRFAHLMEPSASGKKGSYLSVALVSLFFIITFALLFYLILMR